MPPWTLQDIPPLTGKHAVVTGANSGLGFITARELARAGASVVLACRDTGRGDEARERIRREVPQATIRVDRLDLADLQAVRAFAAKQPAGIDLLVNNAGVMALPRGLTRDGFETQFGANHLGHFALTGLLLPAMNPGGRIVTLSSGFHRLGRMRWNDLQGERRYNRWAAYSQSKLANLMFMLALHRRLRDAGRDLRSVGAHPGYAATHLQQRAAEAGGEGLEGLLRAAEGRMMALMNALIAQTDVMGALPTLYAATRPDFPGGAYAGPGGRSELRGYPVRVQPARHAANEADQDRLWRISEDLTGVRYP